MVDEDLKIEGEYQSHDIFDRVDAHQERRAMWAWKKPPEQNHGWLRFLLLLGAGLAALFILAYWHSL